MKKINTILSVALLIAGLGLFSGELLGKDDVSNNLKLKTTKDKILQSYEYEAGNCLNYEEVATATSTQKVCASRASKKEIKYVFKTETETGAGQYTYKDKKLDEIMSLRTEEHQVYDTGEIENGQKVYVMITPPRENYIQDGEKWLKIDYATTTKDAFDSQTKVSWLEKIINGAMAAISDIVSSADTYYGSYYSPGPNGSQETMNVGGWSDHYYDYLNFNLAGAPSAANTSQALLYVYITSAGASDPKAKVYRVTSSWDEATLTRTVSPTHDSTASTSLPSLATTGAKSSNITALYKSWMNGTYTNYGVTIRDTDNNNTSTQMGTRENATEAYRPYLEITYTVDTCTYPGSGDWLIQQSDNCYIGSSVYVNGVVNLIGSSTGIIDCAPGVKISVSKWNFDHSQAPTRINQNCKAFHF